MRMRIRGPRAAQMAAGANTSVLSLSDDLLNSRARRSGLGTRVGSRLWVLGGTQSSIRIIH